MTGDNNQKDGGGNGENSKRGGSSTDPSTLFMDVGNGTSESLGLSHLALRLWRDSQRYGTYANTMPYFSSALCADTCIRMITLHPGDLDDPISCELSVEPLNDLPPFEALSYSWGDPELRTPIIVSGQAFKVTVNLATALHYLRYPDRPRLLWVDAICIDQRNAQEINVQVRHMVDIYGRAAGVLAWLGPDSGFAGPAFEILRTISDRVSHGEIELLTALFSQPYWTRLWIVQELVLARELQFVCGYEYLSWAAIHRFFDHKLSSGATPFDTLPQSLRTVAYRLRHIWHARNIRSMGRNLTFSQLLNKYNPCRCSEIKDYVYSLLGLAQRTSAIHRFIQPDYTDTTSTEDVFRNATASAILEDQNLNVLCLVRRYSCHNPDNITSPVAISNSWVGDWSCVRVIRPLIEPDDAKQLYSAYKPGRFSEQDNLDLKDIGVLKVYGAVVDTLDAVSVEANPLSEDWEACVQSWEPSNIQVYQYPSQESAEDAFWRTLIMDDCFAPFHRKHERVVSSHMDDYRELYRRWRYHDGDNHPDDNRSFADCIRWGAGLNTLAGWTFATTKKGFFARVQPDAEEGDMVVLLQGSSVPFVLRPFTELDHRNVKEPTLVENALKMIGTAYVHGIMDGEAVTNGLLSTQQAFHLV
ncbi:heterokaryon incompatibility protein-domain-containing protein [Xylariaceae sp. FL1272]|nr:heterokaryon incompatibility protein-domain-containing protein [Xylariaceae sp. FL1272]